MGSTASSHGSGASHPEDSKPLSEVPHQTPPGELPLWLDRKRLWTLFQACRAEKSLYIALLPTELFGEVELAVLHKHSQ